MDRVNAIEAIVRQLTAYLREITAVGPDGTKHRAYVWSDDRSVYLLELEAAVGGPTGGPGAAAGSAAYTGVTRILNKAHPVSYLKEGVALVAYAETPPSSATERTNIIVYQVSEISSDNV